MQLHDCPACRAAWLEKRPEAERAKAKEALKLYNDAQALLKRLIAGNACCKALYEIFPSVSEGDNIRIADTVIPVLRQQLPNDKGQCLSLADYVMPASEGRNDYVGVFAVTAGDCMEELRARYEQEEDSYHLMLLQTLSDRLAEASAEYLHTKVRREYWGYVPDFPSRSGIDIQFRPIDRSRPHRDRHHRERSALTHVVRGRLLFCTSRISLLHDRSHRRGPADRLYGSPG